ncbi:hypothetical protein V3391_06655 [Luteimonas sp. SMYT11W]|uniref:Helix-turn-helix domain-containing protein n=1 Tax=Luteimonas flava TaxID=3115822 RepID=A0ABU7WDT1_9GAMM
MSALNPLQSQEPRWLAGMPKAKRRSSPLRGETMTLAHAARVVSWAMTLRQFPAVQDFMQRWECSLATAYRWRTALADGFGVEPPPNPPGTAAIGPSNAPVHSRRAP